MDNVRIYDSCLYAALAPHPNVPPPVPTNVFSHRYGPSGERVQGLSPTDPPIYDPTGDHQEWRRNNARCVDNIAQAAEKGEDRMYKDVFATLANHLHVRDLPSDSNSFMDKAQTNGQINYKLDDQVAVELLDLEPPIPVVTRLISFCNRVNTCARRNNEDFSAFVSRFH